MVEITELNREPASTVSTLTASTEVTSPSVDATDVTSETVTASTEVTSPSVTANALEATDEFTPPVVATEADLPDPANTPEGAEVTVLTDPNGETSVYKVVDN